MDIIGENPVAAYIAVILKALYNFKTGASLTRMNINNKMRCKKFVYSNFDAK